MMIVSGVKHHTIFFKIKSIKIMKTWVFYENLYFVLVLINLLFKNYLFINNWIYNI